MVIIFLGCSQYSPEKRELIRIFEHIDGEVYDGKGLSEFNNKFGYLALGESLILQSYIEMYRATGEIDYLKKMTEQYSRMLINRDDRFGKRDDYTNKVYPAWGSSKFTQEKWRAWLFHQAFILYPVLMFVDTVKADPKLTEIFGKEADKFLKESEKTIDSFDDQWMPDGDGGYYKFPSRIHTLTFLPYYQQNSAGMVYILLAKITGEEKYRDRAERIAREFKKSLHFDQVKNLYWWTYGAPTPRETQESIADNVIHGGTCTDFAILAYQNNIVFDKTDIGRFLNTFHQNIVLEDGTIATYVNGVRKGNEYPAIDWELGRWLGLAEFDRQVFTIIYNHFMKLEKIRTEEKKTLHYRRFTILMLTAARLCRFSD